MNDQLDGEIRALLARVQDLTPLPPALDGLASHAGRARSMRLHPHPGRVAAAAILAGALALTGLAAWNRSTEPAMPAGGTATMPGTPTSAATSEHGTDVTDVSRPTSTDAESTTTTTTATTPQSPPGASGPTSSIPVLVADSTNGFVATSRFVDRPLPMPSLGDRVTLLGWPDASGGLVPVIVAVAAEDAPTIGTVTTFVDGDLTGTIERFTEAGMTFLRTTWAGPGGRFQLVVQAAAVPTDSELRAVAASLADSGTTLQWAAHDPPAPFVELATQNSASQWASTTFTREAGATFDGLVKVGEAGAFPLAIALEQRVERHTFGACDGVMLTGGDDSIPARLVFCTMPDGTKVVARSALTTVDDLTSIIAALRPATEEEAAAIPIVAS